LPAFPQTKKELEKKKAAIEKEIENTNKLLNQTKKNKASTLNQVVMLNKKISYRSELIHTVNQQIDEVDDEIGTTTHNIDSLEQRMTDLKKYYAQMLYFAYKNQSAYSRLTFIFSATDFNQAYKRMKYMQQLSAYRLHQRDLIQQTQADLSQNRQAATAHQAGTRESQPRQREKGTGRDG
jgi:septal ring factor EnvC (AmiA/AmiB activator)